MTDIRPSRLRRIARGGLTVTGTLVVLAVAGLAVQQGATFLSQRAEAAAPPPAAAPLPVEVRPLEVSSGYDVARSFLGQVEAGEASALSFELGGRVVEITVDEGDQVRAGQVIGRLDTALLETERQRLLASRAALEADLAFAERSLTRREALEQRGFSPEEALDQARFSRDALIARIAETDALLANVAVRMEKSVLRAPFAGRVSARTVDTGATIGVGQGVVTLLADAAPMVRVGLPLWVEVSDATPWRVDIGEQTFDAALDSVRPDIDPATRTRTVLLRLDGAEPPFGAVARVSVPRQVVAEGAWVPVEALREGAPGVWTILAADTDDTVRAVPVEVLHAEADRVFVSGPLQAGLALITGGPHRVTPGQTIAPQGTES